MEENTRIGQGWISFCVNSYIGHRVYGKYLVLTVSEIIGETNSQLQSDSKLWKKHVSRYLVMLSYIWYCNQLFYILLLALTHLITLLGFGRWLTYNNTDLESVALITLRSSFVLLDPMGLLRMKSEYAENTEY